MRRRGQRRHCNNLGTPRRPFIAFPVQLVTFTDDFFPASTPPSSNNAFTLPSFSLPIFCLHLSVTRALLFQYFIWVFVPFQQGCKCLKILGYISEHLTGVGKKHCSKVIFCPIYTLTLRELPVRSRGQTTSPPCRGLCFHL